MNEQRLISLNIRIILKKKSRKFLAINEICSDYVHRSALFSMRTEKKREKQEKEKMKKARVVSTSFESLGFQKESKTAKRAKEKAISRNT